MNDSLMWHILWSGILVYEENNNLQVYKFIILKNVEFQWNFHLRFKFERYCYATNTSVYTCR